MAKQIAKKIKLSAPEPSADVCLASVLDMRRARELKDTLLSLVAQGRSCRLDASSVQRISTGCIQVLAAFAKSMAASGHTVTVVKPSAAFLTAFRELGLSGVLEQFSMEPVKCVS